MLPASQGNQGMKQGDMASSQAPEASRAWGSQGLLPGPSFWYFVFSLCLEASGPVPGRPERKRFLLQPPLGSPAPSQGMDEQSHEATADKESDPRTGGNTPLSLGHSPLEARVSSGKWVLHLPFFPPSAVESMPGKKHMGNVTSFVPSLSSQREGARYKASRDQGLNPGPDT